MKFVHIGDLHLGKILNNRSFIQQQKEVLFELLEFMTLQHIPVLVIAGDVYDRLVPPIEAVNLFNKFLEKAILELGIKVLIISGNHDSHERLQFASSILKKQGLVISGTYNGQIDVFEYDNVKFHLLPFVKPAAVRDIFNDSSIKTYQEAMECILNHHQINKNEKNVMITHQFLAGTNQNIVTSDSEVLLSVGGSELIDVHLFDDYDYVALGHLHAPQKISRETVRYSGSLLRYSFDEVKQKKSICVVDFINKNNIKIECVEMHPSLTLKKYKGELEDFLDIEKTPVDNFNDYLFFDLTNKQLIPQAMDKLRSIYPNTLQINYGEIFDIEQFNETINIQKLNESTIFSDFYKLIRNEDLNQQQQEIVDELLIQAGEIE